MTPAEHLAVAEAWLSMAPPADAQQFTTLDIAMSVSALAHAVVALAAELGVPHAPEATGGAGARA